MKKNWFKHGKWPKALVGLHYYSIVSFVFLMLTGVALFLPVVHTLLIPYLPLVYYLHIVLGVLFAASLLVPLVLRLPLGKLIRRLDWMLPIVLGSAIVVTGLFLWQVTWFPTSWRSLAFRWHGWVSYVLGIWFVVHGVYKAVGYRPRSKGINGRVDPDRRQFLQWLGTGVAAAAVMTVIDPVGLIARVFSSSRGSSNTVALGGRFAEYYTVTGGYPATTLASYRLQVDGRVERPVTLDWNQLTALEGVQQIEDFHCVTGWSVAGVHWKGIHLSSIVNRVRPLTDAKYIHFYSLDGAYTECLSIQEALDPSVLLAYELDGQPLSTPQGFPIRLVVPKMYGYKSIKWVNRLEFSSQPLTGYWEARGYPNEAFLGTSI